MTLTQDVRGCVLKQAKQDAKHLKIHFNHGGADHEMLPKTEFNKRTISISFFTDKTLRKFDAKLHC